MFHTFGPCTASTMHYRRRWRCGSRRLQLNAELNNVTVDLSQSNKTNDDSRITFLIQLPALVIQPVTTVHESRPRRAIRTNNWKRVCDVLLVRHCDYEYLWVLCDCDYCDYLAPFLRYGDLLAKNCLFLLPLSHSVPSLPMFPLEFRGDVNCQETSHGAILQWIPHDRSLSRFDTIPDCDGQTDGQTDRRTEGRNLS